MSRTRPDGLNSGEAARPPGPGFRGVAPAAPISAQLRERRQATRQVKTPSWLMSLATHMTVLVMIGALAMTPGARGHLRPIVLTLSLAEGEDDTNSNPVATTVVVSQPEQDDGQFGSRTDRETIEHGKSTESTKPAEEKPSQPAPPKLARTTTVFRPVATWGRLPNRAESRQTQVGRRDARRAWSPAGVGPSLNGPTDETVERFIQYDLGRLPGMAGARARHDFHQLGPDAIPALVRGLNRAAALRASCPVAVISSRLTSLLGQTNDPTMIRYALDHIGQGVDATDPHYRSILSLAHRLKALFHYRDPPPSSLASRPHKWWMPAELQGVGPSSLATGPQYGGDLDGRSRLPMRSGQRPRGEPTGPPPSWHSPQALLQSSPLLKPPAGRPRERRRVDRRSPRE